jgi:YfiH family protein
VSFWRFEQPTDPTGVGWAFTDRHNGFSRGPYASLNFGRTDLDDPDDLARNYEFLATSIGCDRLAVSAQVHGTTVADIGADSPVMRAGSIREEVTRQWPEADALVTSERGVGLVIRVADCVPIVLADPAASVIAVAHAGRVGLLAGVIESTLATMADHGATRVRAWVGPHICGACYEVPADMAQAAWDRNPATVAKTRWGTDAIDLGAGARAVLEAHGAAVEMVDPCTFEDSRFYSHRRDQGVTGRLCGVIWQK